MITAGAVVTDSSSKYLGPRRLPLSAYLSPLFILRTLANPSSNSKRFRDAGQAREALEKMNGFDLAGRPIRVGLGNDKFTPESTANLLQRFHGPGQQFQGSAFSGAGGRGPPASAFDRAGGRDNDKGAGASALDDTDVAGVNFSNYSRDALMRKLARTDEPLSLIHI